MSTERDLTFSKQLGFLFLYLVPTHATTFFCLKMPPIFLRSDYSTGDVGEAGGEENNKDIGGGGGGVGQTVPDDFDEVRTSSIRHIISNGLS